MSVAQEDEYGCGPACMAYVTGKSYGRIVELLGKDMARKRGFYCKELQMALKTLGYDYSYCYAKKHSINFARREGSIVYIRKSKAYPAGHYLAYSGGRWMDPWINFCRNKDILHAVSGYRIRLPGTIQYILYKNSEKPLQKL